MTEELEPMSQSPDGTKTEPSVPVSAGTLVAHMVAAGEWPEPDLLAQIAAAEQEAIEPLCEVLRTRTRGWPGEAPICHAAGLLGMLKARSAIPELCAAARFYKNDSTESLGNALAAYGRPGLDALIELVQDPGVSGYQRDMLIDSAARAAGHDEGLRAQLAIAVRGVFAKVMEEARQAEAFETELLAEHPLENSSVEEDVDDEELDRLLDEETIDAEDLAEVFPSDESDSVDDLDGEEISHMEDSSNEVAPAEALELLALDLAVLDDADGKALIQTAAEEGLVHEGELYPEVVEELFQLGGEILEPPPPWLEEYKTEYASRKEYEQRLAAMPQVEFPSVASYPSLEPVAGLEPAPRVEPIEPIRNSGPRIGRNDPCWCGSGKKYKKCHLGKDTPH